MAQNFYMQTFEVRNSDIWVKFNCLNHKNRIEECVHNLEIKEDDESLQKKQAFFTSSCPNVKFRFGLWADNEDGWIDGSEMHKDEAFFFENTDYPVRIIPNSGVNNTHDIRLLRIVIGKEENLGVAAEDDIIFGTINFRNQVGRTDFKVVYSVNGIEKTLSFSTEVLSYKMDYRTDMRQVIADIEEEFSMLSYSLLKETYLTFKQSNKDSTNLIWWQVFRDCYKKIVESIDFIISNPKRRLKSDVRYERVERILFISPELENEYAEFENNPSHLYRVEDLFLSKDTVENRFLKYAILNTLNRFNIVQKNILSILKLDNMDLKAQIQNMNSELERLAYHPFFRGVGDFKGFTQDSLVMKQSHGYKDVYECWIILQCGYDLQEGIMQLEVKDISDLYEIWCFIKVKNIVNHILLNKADQKVSGNQTEGHFIKNLIQGKSSEVCFYDKENKEVMLASLMYNATSDDEAIDEFDPTKQKTDIIDTTSKTTEQRPDIVLRLTKSNDTIKYTYLFDAKYRLNDTQIFGSDVPPVSAINQMHRYRDAIYYTKSDDLKLKKEVIGGYVLYPGNLSKDQFNESYYKKSIDEVNIGAFPLKPGNHWENEDPKLYVNPNSSEDVLYHTIEKWLNENEPRHELLDVSIPQKGLNYVEDESLDSCVLIQRIDEKLDYYDDLINGKSESSAFDITGSSLNIQNLRYYVPVTAGYEIKGYYKIKSAILSNISPGVFCIKFGLSDYIPLTNTIPYPLLRVNPKGFECNTKREFDDFLRRQLY